MFFKKMLFGLGLSLLASTAMAEVVHIPDGDVDALRTAVDKANERPGVLTTIELAPNGHYATGLPQIFGKLRILGNSATLDGAGELNRALTVSVEFPRSAAPGAKIPNVQIYDLNIQGFQSDQEENTSALLIGVYNGQLLLDRVTLANNMMSPLVGGRPPIGTGTMIFNGLNAHTTLLNVTISGNVASSASIVGVAIQNLGVIDIKNSTFTDNLPEMPDQFLPTVATFGKVSFANTIIADSTVRNCAAFHHQGGAVESLGHNIDSDGSCGFAGPGDLSNVDPLLSELSDDAIPVHHLLPGSPALDAGDNALCAATDAQGRLRPADGDGDGTATCDIGAVEEPAPDGGGPGLTKLADGGFNGFYFNRANDGHYVTIQRVRDNDILVIWNTFDRFGVPAWIYGVGHQQDHSITVQAWENTGGVLQSGGAPTGQSAQPWGTMEVDLASCEEGTFKYDSSLPGFGSGEFELDRLGFAFELGCTSGNVQAAAPSVPVALHSGGFNGFYFNRTHDGHYVTIQRVREKDILVIWNTFDGNGAPAWVFGVGQREGDKITVDAYRQTGGVLQQGGAPTGQTAERWGQLEVDLSDCQGGTFKYDSALPGFGAGEFALDRLAFAFELGCVE